MKNACASPITRPNDCARHAIAIENSEFVEPCDTLLVAIGQKSITDYLDLQVELDRWGNVSIDERGMTNIEGLFAAGDHVTGATTAGVIFGGIVSKV